MAPDQAPSVQTMDQKIQALEALQDQIAKHSDWQINADYWESRLVSEFKPCEAPSTQQHSLGSQENLGSPLPEAIEQVRSQNSGFISDAVDPRFKSKEVAFQDNSKWFHLPGGWKKSIRPCMKDGMPGNFVTLYPPNENQALGSNQDILNWVQRNPTAPINTKFINMLLPCNSDTGET